MKISHKRCAILPAALAAALMLVTAAASAQGTDDFRSLRAAADQEPTADAASPFLKDVPGVVIIRSVMGEEVPEFRAEVRSRWTPDNIYFLFIGPYRELNVKPDPDLEKETYKLWERDCFEVYAGADFANIKRYREFQMSPQGEFLDLDIDASKPRPGWSDERYWDSGMKVKARIDAAKKIWYGEMRIPLKAIDARPAKAGNELRVNLFRQDGAAPKRFFLAWKPTGVWNPHHPDKFGILTLVGTDHDK